MNLSLTIGICLPIRNRDDIIKNSHLSMNCSFLAALIQKHNLSHKHDTNKHKWKTEKCYRGFHIYVLLYRISFFGIGCFDSRAQFLETARAAYSNLKYYSLKLDQIKDGS